MRPHVCFPRFVAHALALLFSASLMASPVATYHAENSAADETGNGHDGTAGPDVTFTTGRLGQGFNFPGTSTTLGNNAVVLPSSSDFTPANITISAWVMFNSLGATISGDTAAGIQYLLVKQNGRTYEQGYAISYCLAKLPDNRLTFGVDFGQNDEVVVNSTTTVLAGRWYHVVASYDHQNLKIYVNGRLEGATAETRDLLTASTPVYLGRTNALFHDGLFNGVMDEVQFFNTALTPFQIPALDPANDGSGLVSWWRGEGNGKDFQGLNDGGSFAPGKVGRSFRFDGARNYVTTGPSSGCDLGSNDFTIDGWINVLASVPFMRLLSAGSPTSNPNHLWTLGYGNGWGGGDRLNFYYWNGSGFVDITSDPVSIGTGAWHHIAAVRSGSTLTFYFDGSPVGSGSIGTIGAADPSTGFILGARYQNNSSGLFELANGGLDEVDLFNRGLAASEVQSIYNAGSAGKTPGSFAPNLVAWWKGEDNANDSQGSNHGTLFKPEDYDASGKVGQAFTISPAAGNYVYIADSPSLRVKTFTIDAWVNFNALPAIAGHIFGKALGGGDANSYVLWYQNGGLHGYVEGGPTLTYNWSPTLGQWYHVAYTYDGGTHKLYVDGSEVASGASTAVPGYDAHPALIGADYSGGNITYQFDGKIDEVDLFNRALSQPEIQAIRNAGASGKPTGPSISISNAAVMPGATSATFDVTVARPNSTEVTVDYATVDGSALAPTDYSPVFFDTLTIPANTTSATISVPLTTTPASFPRTFYLTLSNATNGTINRGYAVGTLLSGDAVADFSQDSNAPTQLWQYGDTAPDGTGFTLYTYLAAAIAGNANLVGWVNGGYDAVVFNTTSQNQGYNIYTNQQPDELGMFPLPNGTKSVVRWLAPASGTYSVAGRFRSMDIARSDGSIVKNGNVAAPLFNQIVSPGNPQAFSLNVTVDAGDTLDFRVGVGDDGFGYDGTGLAVSITNGPLELPAIATDASSKTGPTTPGGTITFVCTTQPDVNVRVQATTTPDDEGSWTDLTGGGAMTQSAAGSGSYSLDATGYPTIDGVYFRFISWFSGYTDGKSDPHGMGPYDLRLSPPAIAPFTADPPALPGDPMHFTAETAPGSTLKLQSSTNGTTWTYVSGATATEDSAGHYDLITSNYPAVNGVSFRLYGTNGGLMDASSSARGPFNLAPPSSAKLKDLLGFVTSSSDPTGTTTKGVHTYTTHTGDTVRIELAYFNNDATAIIGANVQLPVPASFLTITGTSPAASIITSGTNKIVKWSFDIPAHTQGTLFLQGTVASATPNASWTPVAGLYKNTTKLVSATLPKISVTESLQFTLEASTDSDPTGATVHSGEAIQYIVSVRNPTPNAVTNVKMGMAFPAGTHYLTQSTPPGGVTFATRGKVGAETGIDWTIANLTGNGYVSVFVLVIVDAADPAPTGKPAPITQTTATCTHGSFKITAPPLTVSVISSLEVKLFSDINIVRPGDVIHFEFDVHNYGTVPLVNAKLVTLLPQGMRLSAANSLNVTTGNFDDSAYNGDQLTGTTNPAVDRSKGPTQSTLTWTWASFPAKAGKTVRFACQAMYDDPLEYILNGAHVTNQVDIYSYNFVGNLATNTAKRLYAAKPGSTLASATPLQLLAADVTRVSANLSGEPNVPPNLSLAKTASGDGETVVGNETIATVINDPATTTDGVFTYTLKVVNGKVHDPAFPNDPARLIPAGTASKVEVHDFLPAGTTFLGFLALDGTPVPSYTNFHFFDVNGKEIPGAGEDFTDKNGNQKWDAGEPFTDANGNKKYDGISAIRSFILPLYDLAGDVTHTYTYKVQTTLAAGGTITSNSGGYSGKVGLYTFDAVAGYHVTASNLNFPVNGGPDQLQTQVVLPAKFNLPAGVLFSRPQLVGNDAVSVAVPVNVLGGTSLGVSGVKIEVPIAKGYVASNAQLLDNTGTPLPITINPGNPDSSGTRKLSFPVDTRRGATAVFQVAVDQANINTLLDATHKYFKAPLSIKPTVTGTFTKPLGGGAQTITSLTGLGVLPVLGTVSTTTTASHAMSHSAESNAAATTSATGDSQVFIGRCAPAVVRRGDTLTYTIFVGNLTVEVLRYATITMKVPAGTTFKSASNYIFNFMVTGTDGSDTGNDSGNAVSKDPFKATVSGTTVKWDLAALLPAEAGVVTLTVNVPSTFSGSRIEDSTCAFDALNCSGKNAGSQSVVVLSGNETAQSASALQGVIEGLGADFNDDVRTQLTDSGFKVGRQSCVTSIGGTDLVHLSNDIVVIPLPGDRTFCFGPSRLVSASDISLLNDDGMMRIAVGRGSMTGTGAISLDLSSLPGLASAHSITPNSILSGFVTNQLVSTNGGNVVAQGAGNVVAAGAGNVVAAGAGNVVAAGAGNFSGTSLGGAGGAQLKLPDGAAAASLQLTFGSHVVAQGAGNVVAAGAGNVVAAGAGNVVAAGAGNFVKPAAGVVAAGAGNVVAQGAGNVVAQGAGNVVAAGAGNIVSAGAGNVVAAGAGNFTPANFK